MVSEAEPFSAPTDRYTFLRGEKTRQRVQSPGARAQLIQANSDGLRVITYDVNTVRFKTNFKTEKFLVYNDGFYPGWQARINGRSVKIYKTNLAFKGFRVPSGENTVVLKFGYPVRYFLGYILLILCPALLVAVIMLGIRSSGMNDVKNQK